MRRIANGTQVAALPTPAAAIGTPGYASNGDPAAGVQATIWDADMANILIEEFMAFLVAAGIAPDGNNREQVLQAVKRLMPHDCQVFLSPGIFTFTVPANIYWMHGEVVGGGGGGGGTSNGGAAGGAGAGRARGWFAVTPGQKLNIVVGSGGMRGSGAPTAGTNGGASSIGGVMSATGGRGGDGAAGGSSAPVNGSPGVGSGGQINETGNITNGGLTLGGVPLGSAGGSAPGGSLVAGFTNAAGNGASFPGGGGGGAGGLTHAEGSNGAGGRVILTW